MLKTADRFKPGSALHLYMRIPASVVDLDKVATEHSNVIAQEGAVWLGILGKAITSSRLCELRKRGNFLFLVQKKPAGAHVYKGKFADIGEHLPDSEAGCIPQYYRDQEIAKRAKVWVKLVSLERSSPDQLKSLRVASTGTPVPQLLNSMTSIAIVEESSL